MHLWNPQNHLVHMDNMNNPLLHKSADSDEMMSREIQALQEKLDKFIPAQQKQQLQTKPFPPYNQNQRFIPQQQYQGGYQQQQYVQYTPYPPYDQNQRFIPQQQYQGGYQQHHHVQNTPFLPYNQNHGFVPQQQFYGDYQQQPVINAPDPDIKTMLQQLLQSQATYYDTILGSLSEFSKFEFTTREEQPTITEDIAVQVGEDFCEKSTQEVGLDVLTRPGDRVKPTYAEKPYVSRKNETLYVPPPYKPPLPFPGRIKKESMEKCKEISEEQLKEIEVHIPLVDECKLIPPHLEFLKEAVIEKNAQTKDELLLEAEECIKEFEMLLGCTVDENLVIRYEEQVKPVAIMISSTKSNGEVVGVVGKTFENPCEGVVVLEHIADKHIDIASTYEVSSDEPRKIPFEEIRMKAFRGWFYDEYAPGDTWIH